MTGSWKSSNDKSGSNHPQRHGIQRSSVIYHEQNTPKGRPNKAHQVVLDANHEAVDKIGRWERKEDIDHADERKEAAGGVETHVRPDKEHGPKGPRDVGKQNLVEEPETHNMHRVSGGRVSTKVTDSQTRTSSHYHPGRRQEPRTKKD